MVWGISKQNTKRMSSTLWYRWQIQLHMVKQSWSATFCLFSVSVSVVNPWFRGSGMSVEHVWDANVLIPTLESTNYRFVLAMKNNSMDFKSFVGCIVIFHCMGCSVLGCQTSPSLLIFDLFIGSRVSHDVHREIRRLGLKCTVVTSLPEKRIQRARASSVAHRFKRLFGTSNIYIRGHSEDCFEKEYM